MPTDNHDDTIEFTFSYLALGLLGKNLYSNAWAALSELVANSLDARANNVYVYVDMRQKGNSIIEVFDDGDGMSRKDLRENYIQIGRNRRISQENAESVMGRKGIGKLAALYLSTHYYVASSDTENDLLIYEMNFPKDKEHDNSHPQMTPVEEVSFFNKDFLNFPSGTMIRMENTDLSGYGDVSVKSLNSLLSDFFSFSHLGNQSVKLKVVMTNKDLQKDFVTIKKEVPFRNMSEIVCFDKETYKELVQNYSDNTFELPYRKHEKKFLGKTKISLREAKNHSFQSESGEKTGKISGWIGIHSTIKLKDAQDNDVHFKKDKLYNPLSLRIYVRNKLAISNFLPVINNTQAFVNYIEGEVGYDILDDNDFPDIATTSRQNMDESDPRVKQLAKELQEEVRSLIKSRLNLKNDMQRQGSELDFNSETVAKQEVSKNFDSAIENYKHQKIPGETEDKRRLREEIVDTLSNHVKPGLLQGLKGENLKTDYMIFFSHSRKNSNILDFFYNLLKSRGVHEEEMFYTSKSNSPQIKSKENLGEISRKNITNLNTVVFFYTTNDFRESEYCMFEGGAAWATRTKEDVFVSFDDHKKIPDYLKFNDEFLFEITEQTDILVGVNYNKLVDALNFLIKHINVGRKIKTAPEIIEFENVDFPDKVEEAKGMKPTLNRSIIEYWDSYIKKGIKNRAITNQWI